MSATSSSQNFAGDFRVEYLLSPDGRIRINAFSKTDYDAYSFNNRTRSGLGLSYVRDYNKLSELFSDRRIRRIADSTNRAAAARRAREDSLNRGAGGYGAQAIIKKPLPTRKRLSRIIKKSVYPFSISCPSLSRLVLR